MGSGQGGSVVESIQNGSRPVGIGGSLGARFRGRSLDMFSLVSWRTSQQSKLADAVYEKKGN